MLAESMKMLLPASVGPGDESQEATMRGEPWNEAIAKTGAPWGKRWAVPAGGLDACEVLC